MVWKPEMRLIFTNVLFLKQKERNTERFGECPTTQASCSEKQCQGIPVVWFTCGLAGVLYVKAHEVVRLAQTALIVTLGNQFMFATTPSQEHLGIS